MKQLFTGLFVLLFTASAWATPDPVENEKAAAAFEKAFAGATNAHWTSKDDLLVVRFELNHEILRVWYTDEGEMKAMQRTVKQSQMTFPAAKALDELVVNARLINIEEISKDNSLFYLVRTENDQVVSTYQLSVSGDAVRLEKKKKK